MSYFTLGQLNRYHGNSQRRVAHPADSFKTEQPLDNIDIDVDINIDIDIDSRHKHRHRHHHHKPVRGEPQWSNCHSDEACNCWACITNGNIGKIYAEDETPTGVPTAYNDCVKACGVYDEKTKTGCENAAKWYHENDPGAYPPSSFGPCYGPGYQDYRNKCIRADCEGQGLVYVGDSFWWSIFGSGIKWKSCDPSEKGNENNCYGWAPCYQGWCEKP